VKTAVIEFKSGLAAPASATEVCDTLRTILAKYVQNNRVEVVGSGTATLVVTGLTGFPIFRMTIVRGGTAAETFATKAPNGTPGTALAGTTTVTVTTLAAHGLATGALVSISTATGFTFTRDGVSTVVAIDKVRIHVASSTTFTLTGVTGAGTNTGTIVITVLPSESTGAYAKVLAETADQGAILAPASGRQYSKYIFEYSNPVSSLNSIARNQAGMHVLFVDDQFDTATPTNFINFNNRVIEIANGFVAGGTTADPQFLASPYVTN
jgi:hypothetical protein